MAVDPLTFLEQWFLSQCGEDWLYGPAVKIDTLGNPGWYLTVPLEGTPLEGRTVDWVRDELTESDWLHYWSDGQKFDAACGPLSLRRALRAFMEWAS